MTSKSREPIWAVNANIVVVIVNYRTPELTKRCLASLRGERELLPNLKAIVVDGGSGDDSAANLARAIEGPDYQGWVAFLPLPLNGGFGWANNQAILTLAREPAPPDYIYLLNPDAEVVNGATMSLAVELEGYPRCAAAGSQLLSSNGRETASAFRFPSPGREFVNAAQSAKLGRILGIAPTIISEAGSAEADWVTGASVMFRSAALREVGLFDDGFFLYFDEVELMHRMRAAGWTIRYAPQSRVVHAEGASTGMGSAAVTEVPAYWYNSRRRYFTLTGGRRAVLAANIGWVTGMLVGMIKRIVRPYSDRRFRLSKLFERPFESVEPSVPAWGDAPGAPPAWMGRR